MNKSKPISIINCLYKCYEIGAMENTANSDGGVSWRRHLTPDLNRRGIYVFDPTQEESKKTGMSADRLIKTLATSLEKEDYDSFRKLMKKVWKGVDKFIVDSKSKESVQVKILGDIGYVENSDFLIWHHREKDLPGGTIAELIIAWSKGIPVYLVTEVPPTKLNKSLLFFLFDSGNGEGKLFKNFKELLKFIDVRYNLKKIK